MDKKDLHGWVITYNMYENTYIAVPREFYFELTNGDEGHVLKSRSFKTLEELIMKTQGDKDKLENLLKN